MTITDQTASAPRPARRQAIAGTYNLRDTGGYPAATGETRWGTLYRSDALHRLTDASREQLAELGIRLVVDLRDASELAGSPSRLDGLGIEVVHTPIYPGAAPVSDLGDITLEGLYHRMIAEYGQNLAAAVRLIARSGGQGVLVHCTAGKDRTGLVVALALSAAGVEREAVVADYAETEANLRGEWVAEMLERMLASGFPAGEAIEQIISASPPELIAGILDRIDEEHGSVRTYLRTNGLSDAELDLLTTVLITESPLTSPASPLTSKENRA